MNEWKLTKYKPEKHRIKKQKIDSLKKSTT